MNYFQPGMEFYIVTFSPDLNTAMAHASEQVPLCVDLDGTLLRTDSLLESVVALLKQHPLAIGDCLLALRQGRAHFKAWIAERQVLDVTSLPLNNSLVDWLSSQYQEGRPIILVTAADRSIAEEFATHLDLFSEVLASDGKHNLKGEAKAAVLATRFGRGGFDYAGDSRADLPVWLAARRAIIVGNRRIQLAAAKVAEVERVFSGDQRTSTLLLRALRPHQWVKNLLIFVPLLAAHRLADGHSLLIATLAFVCFSITASAVYLLNDLLDIQADRLHPQKCRRPFASGELPLVWGVVLPPLLFLAALGIALLWLPLLFTLVLLGYFAITIAYSLKLKSLAIIDVLILAGLYTVRVIAGAAAVAIMPSVWLLAFSMLMFTSLALVKRYTELHTLQQRGGLTAAGRGWHVDDLPLVSAIGAAAGIACVLVLALYIDSQTALQLYQTPAALWLICPLLLYWIGRLWFKAHRGEVHDDPVVFALTDRISLFIALLSAAIMAVASGLGT